MKALSVPVYPLLYLCSREWGVYNRLYIFILLHAARRTTAATAPHTKSDRIISCHSASDRRVMHDDGRGLFSLENTATLGQTVATKADDTLWYSLMIAHPWPASVLGNYTINEVCKIYV